MMCFILTHLELQFQEHLPFEGLVLEALADRIKYDENYFLVLQGEIIEDYPSDKPFPDCFIFGETFSGDSVHSVWAYNKENK